MRLARDEKVGVADGDSANASEKEHRFRRAMDRDPIGRVGVRRLAGRCAKKHSRWGLRKRQEHASLFASTRVYPQTLLDRTHYPPPIVSYFA